MKTLLATTILVASLSVPAFAQMADDMSCTDFMAMDSSGQMQAMESMAGAMAGDAMMSSEGDAMKPDAMADDHMGVTADTVADACADHGDMMVQDAIEQAKMAK
jgi:hypothetical protein